MIRTVVFYFAFALTLLRTVPSLIKAKRIRRKEGDYAAAIYSEKTVRRWAKSNLNFAKAEVEVSGLENIPEGERLVFISNHQSNFDIALIIYYIPVQKGFIAKKEMEIIPIMKSWMELMGCVFIDRGNARNSAESIIQATKNVKNNINMTLFPEGTRSKRNAIGEFKSGGFRVATKSNATIVPITIDGSYKLLEEKGRITPSKVRLVVHKPIRVRELSKEEKDNIDSVVKTVIESEFKGI